METFPSLRVGGALFGVLAALLTLCPTSQAAVGHTPAQFSVSQTGAATYTIPIWSPPGVRGVEPHLALVYDSPSGNGVLGPGWSLAGLSAITRCTKTWAQDSIPAAVSLSVSDGYCMDGKRLRLTGGAYGVDGSTYQTELADFSNVIAHGVAGNGPAWFEVKGKDGRTYEYGNTTDSRVLAPSTPTAYLWQLNKVRDRQSNVMTVIYSLSTGSSVPAYMVYTAAPAYQVVFSYGARVATDNINQYISNSKIQTTQQLASIAIKYANNTILRQYNLSYIASPTTLRARLASVQECVFNPAQDCLPATVISYQNGQAGVASVATSAGTGSTVNLLTRAVDMNGDGRTDLVYATASGSTNTWWTKFATPAGFGAAVNTGVTTVSGTAVLFDDFDGNGRVDLLAPSGGVWFVLRWNGSAFTWTSTGLAADANASSFNSASADVNGDGLPDLLLHLNNYIYLRHNTSTGGTVSFAPAAITGPQTAAPPLAFLRGNNSIPESPVGRMDFDGDGREDVLLDYTTYNPVTGSYLHTLIQYYSRGTSLIVGVANTTPGAFIRSFPVSWNNDRCTDVVDGGIVRIAGCGTSTAATVSVALPALVTDWDADGRTDILSNSGGTLQVYRSTGDGAAAPVSTGLASGSGYWLAFDQDGDGLDDLAFANSSASYAISYGLHRSAGTKPDLAASITDGFGLAFNPSYVSIARGNYTKLGDASLPEFDYIGPLQVVSQFSASDGAGGTYTNSFWYTGARMHRQGRGFEGFAQKRTQDSRNGLYAYEDYQRTFPYTGASSASALYQPDNATLMRRTTYSFATTTLDSAANNQRYFPFVNQSIEYSHESGGIYNGALIRQATTSYSYDNYGNATQVTVANTDKDLSSPSYNQTWTEILTRTISNDAGTNWCLGLPTQTTLQKTLPNSVAQTRTLATAIDYANCRITQETVEPANSTLKVTSNYGFDACGNVNSVQVIGKNPNGTDMAARTTAANYGSRCQFPESVTNALGQVTQRSWEVLLGVQTGETDPNGLATSWQYDKFARRTRETRPDQTATTWSYNDCGAVSGGCVNSRNRMTIIQSRLNTAGAVVADEWTYTDQLDRPITTKTQLLSGAYNRVDREYDPLGRLSRQSAPCWASACAYYWTSFSYDLFGRPTQVSRPVSDADPTLQTESIYYEGMSVRSVDAQGKQRTRVSNAISQLARVIDHANYAQMLSYDPFGNPAR